MKKFLSLIVLTIILSGTLFSQDCLNDIYYTVVNQKAYGKAIKMMDKKCMPGNEANAQVWLMKANTYFFYAATEMKRAASDTNYIIANPEYIVVAYEAFRKAIELDNQIDENVKSGLWGSKEGQRMCGQFIHDMGKKAILDSNYAKAIEYIQIAQKTYGIVLKGEEKNEKLFDDNMFEVYFDLTRVYLALNDKENTQVNLKKAMSKNKDFPALYYTAYNFFYQNKDTLECGKVIKKTRMIAAKTDNISYRKNYYLLELTYYDMMSMVDTLKSRSMEMINDIGIDRKNKDFYVEVIGTLFNQLIDVETEKILDMYLAIDSTDFDMIKYKGFLNLVKVSAIINENAKINSSTTLTGAEKRKQSEANNVLKNKYYDEAIIWFKKAYEINPANEDVIKYLFQSYSGSGRSAEMDPAFKEKAMKILSGAN